MHLVSVPAIRRARGGDAKPNRARVNQGDHPLHTAAAGTEGEGRFRRNKIGRGQVRRGLVTPTVPSAITVAQSVTFGIVRNALTEAGIEIQPPPPCGAVCQRTDAPCAGAPGRWASCGGLTSGSAVWNAGRP